MADSKRILRVAFTKDLVGNSPFLVAHEENIDSWRESFENKRVDAEERNKLFKQGLVHLKVCSLHTFAKLTPGEYLVDILTEVKPNEVIDKVIYLGNPNGEKTDVREILKGKTLAYPKHGLEHFYLYFFYLYLGIEWDEKYHINTSAEPMQIKENEKEETDRDVMYRLFLSGKAQVILDSEGRLNDFDPKYNVGSFNCSQLPYDMPIFCTALVATETAINEYRGEIENMRVALFKATAKVSDFSEGNKDLSDSTLTKLLQSFTRGESSDSRCSLEEFRSALQAYHFFTLEENRLLLREEVKPSIKDRISACRAIWRCMDVPLIDRAIDDVLKWRMDAHEQE